MKSSKKVKINLIILASLINLNGCSTFWQKEKRAVISDFCISYEPYPASDEMVEELKKTPELVVVWIASNEFIYNKIKKCEDLD